MSALHTVTLKCDHHACAAGITLTLRMGEDVGDVRRRANDLRDWTTSIGQLGTVQDWCPTHPRGIDLNVGLEDLL